MNKDCLFCQIAEKKADSHQLAENEKALAFLDLYPRAKGHTLIIPKKHSVNLLDTAEAEIKATNILAKKICLALQQAFDVDNFLVKSHNGPLARQEIDHFHIHVIPYYSAGQSSQRKKAAQSELKQVQQSITSHLSKI